MPNSALIDELKANRQKFGLTVRAVAEMSGASESTTRKVFGPTQYNFTVETLQPYIDLFKRLEESADDLRPYVDTSAEDRRTIALYERIIMDKNLRIEEFKEQVDSLYSENSNLRQRCAIVTAISVFLLVLLVGLFVYDFFQPDHGWITRLRGLTSFRFPFFKL